MHMTTTRPRQRVLLQSDRVVDFCSFYPSGLHFVVCRLKDKMMSLVSHWCSEMTTSQKLFELDCRSDQ